VILVEAAVETTESAIAAERAGARRVELCARLDEGGTTPGAGLIASVTTQIAIPVFVMIRPRGGGFVYTDDEIGVMKRDIEIARSGNVAGIVTGALDDKGGVASATIRSLIEAAGGLPVTFHRAFDAARDLPEALEMLIDAGVSRVLTSGGASTALEGADTIAPLVDQAKGRIIIVAGGGIRGPNVRQVMARTGVTEVHARMIDEAGMRMLVAMTTS
jgi:copper homeostasis protein